MMIASDMDGIVTAAQKCFYLDSNNNLAKIKMCSDADSSILSKIPNLVFISHDPDINKEWAARHKVLFIHVPHGEEKYEYLACHMEKKSESFYIYVGDTLHDFNCLYNALWGYVPQDAATSLMEQIKGLPNVIIVPRNGGAGVLDWVYCDLKRKNLI